MKIKYIYPDREQNRAVIGEYRLDRGQGVRVFALNLTGWTDSPEGERVPVIRHPQDGSVLAGGDLFKRTREDDVAFEFLGLLRPDQDALSFADFEEQAKTRRDTWKHGRREEDRLSRAGWMRTINLAKDGQSKWFRPGEAPVSRTAALDELRKARV